MPEWVGSWTHCMRKNERRLCSARRSWGIWSFNSRTTRCRACSRPGRLRLRFLHSFRQGEAAQLLDHFLVAGLGTTRRPVRVHSFGKEVENPQALRTGKFVDWHRQTPTANFGNRLLEAEHGVKPM